MRNVTWNAVPGRAGAGPAGQRAGRDVSALGRVARGQGMGRSGGHQGETPDPPGAALPVGGKNGRWAVTGDPRHKHEVCTGRSRRWTGPTFVAGVRFPGRPSPAADRTRRGPGDHRETRPRSAPAPGPGGCWPLPAGRAGGSPNSDRPFARAWSANRPRRWLGAYLLQEARSGPAWPSVTWGSTSADRAELRDRLNVATGLRLPATLIFDYPTPLVVTRWLRDRIAGDRAPVQPTPQAVPMVTGDPVAVVADGLPPPRRVWPAQKTCGSWSGPAPMRRSRGFLARPGRQVA